MEIIVPGKAWKARKFWGVKFELLLAKKSGLIMFSNRIFRPQVKASLSYVKIPVVQLIN